MMAARDEQALARKCQETRVENGDRARLVLVFLMDVRRLKQSEIARRVMRSDSTIYDIRTGGSCSSIVADAIENLGMSLGYGAWRNKKAAPRPPVPPSTPTPPEAALPQRLDRLEAKLDRLLALWEG